MSTKTYPTDLSDAKWKCLRPCLPAPKAPGRPRTHAMRQVLDAIFYVVRSGCPWRLLPRDFPPWQTVYYHLRRWRLRGTWYLILKALQAAERERAGKDPQPTAAIVDSRSVKIYRGIGGAERLRRPQERQGPQAPCPGGHFGPAAFGLRHGG